MPGRASSGTTAANGKLRNDHTYISAVAILRRHTAFFEALIGLFGRDPSSASPAEAVDALERFEESRNAGQSPVQENQEYLYLDVYETANSAPRLPTDLFDGSRDTRWAPDAMKTRVLRTR